MARKYIYNGPADVIVTRDGNAVPKGGEVTLEDAQAIDFIHRGHRFGLAGTGTKYPEAVEAAMKLSPEAATQVARRRSLDRARVEQLTKTVEQQQEAQEVAAEVKAADEKK